MSCLFVLCSEADFPDRGQLPAVQLPSGAGEGERLDKDVGGCDEGRAPGAVLTRQRTGKTKTTRLLQQRLNRELGLKELPLL